MNRCMKSMRWREEVVSKLKAHDENHQNVSFIDSPEVLWEENEVEGVLTRIGNGSIPDKRVLDSLSAAPGSRRAWASQSGKNAKEG